MLGINHTLSEIPCPHCAGKIGKDTKSRTGALFSGLRYTQTAVSIVIRNSIRNRIPTLIQGRFFLLSRRLLNV